MIKRQFHKIQSKVEHNRFQLLLLATVIVLVLPSFTGSGLLSDILFMCSMTFLFLQSMTAADIPKSRRNLIRIIVLVILSLLWLKPAGYDRVYLNIASLILVSMFFMWVIIFLFKFVRKSDAVNRNVLITSINIYLLSGIVAASLAYLLYMIIPNSYNIPDYIAEPEYVHFVYFSFITMATVGYGDITPRTPETQTLAYLVAIAGQLYVAIIIAFLVGKFLVHSMDKESGK